MQIRENISLKRYNTFGIDVNARFFSAFQSIEELKELLAHSKSISHQPEIILGGGSNILFTKPVQGLVLKNELMGVEVVKEDVEHIYVKAGAGENWHGLVMYCVQHAFAGMENLSLIPGNVGASPMQNIGAYGVEVKDVFYELEAYHIKDKTLVKFSLEDCEFGYRESVFKRKYKNQFVIFSVTYRLKKQPVFHTEYGAIQQELNNMGVQELTVNAISQAVITIRSSKLPDPKLIGNAGSFFKNPKVDMKTFDNLQSSFPNMPSFYFDDEHIKLPAGWLIEQCGWKGYRKNDAGCYAKQALVLVNYGHASGKEIYALSEEILLSVQEKFGIDLEREVNIL